jgi:hypothetical protein
MSTRCLRVRARSEASGLFWGERRVQQRLLTCSNCQVAKYLGKLFVGGFHIFCGIAPQNEESNIQFTYELPYLC